MDFFFQLNLLPPCSLRSQGDEIKFSKNTLTHFEESFRFMFPFNDSLVAGVDSLVAGVDRLVAGVEFLLESPQFGMAADEFDELLSNKVLDLLKIYNLGFRCMLTL